MGVNNKNKIIVIAEDSATQAAQLQFILEKNGYTVFHGKNGFEALKLVNDLKPSLVISDIVMPEMQGFELCRCIKSQEETQNIPVILLTSLTHVNDVFDGLECNADSFINKPYSEEFIITYIKKLLKEQELHQKTHSQVHVEVVVAGKKRNIAVDPARMISLLTSTYESAINKNIELNEKQKELNALNNNLEEIVIERTAELWGEIAVRKQSEANVVKLNRIYALLSNINQAIVRIHNTEQLLNEICMIACNEGKFQSAWIGLLKTSSQKITTAASGGKTTNLANINPENNPIHSTADSGLHLISNNIIKDTLLPDEWKSKALSYKFKSLAILPLIIKNKIIGCFSIYSNEIGFFDELEVRLLDELADDISFAIEFIRNEAERIKYEEELVIAKNKAEECDRLKTNFLNNMSHEIRTPMNAILGFTNIVLNESLTNDEKETYSDYIQKNGESLLKIIDDIIDISKLQSKQLNIYLSSFNLHELFVELEIYYKQLLLKKQKNIQFLLAIPTSKSDPFFIESDSIRLKQVLNNLILNAVKYTNEGTIALGYKLNQDQIQFYVTDTGPGIPPKMQKQIFDRFIQYSKHFISREDGTGLGLSIAKELVSMLDGELKVDSQEGVGSTFYFRIPFKASLKETVSFEKETTENKFHDYSKYRILIADDEESNYVLTKRILKPTGIITEWASNGKCAYEMATNNCYDLILMDIKMPEMDGLQATRLIKKHNKNIPIIIQTAFALKEVRDEALKAGCDDFIVKPISIDSFLRITNKYLICKQYS